MTTAEPRDDAALARAIVAAGTVDDVRVHGLGPGPLDRSGVRAFTSSSSPGPLRGVPATGTRVVLPGITILHVRDGLRVERWVVSDLLGLLVRIGAVPAPV